MGYVALISLYKTGVNISINENINTTFKNVKEKDRIGFWYHSAEKITGAWKGPTGTARTEGKDGGKRGRKHAPESATAPKKRESEKHPGEKQTNEREKQKSREDRQREHRKQSNRDSRGESARAKTRTDRNESRADRRNEGDREPTKNNENKT